MPQYSNLTRAQLDELNSFALSEAPSAQENLTRRLQELGRDSSLGGLGMLAKKGGILVTDGTIPNIDHHLELEAMLEFPEELQHPAEQVSVCLTLMAEHERHLARNERLQTQVTYESIQRRLSHLLVAYPVLMDPRVHFAVGMDLSDEDAVDWVPAAKILSTLSFASLPSTTHGLSVKQLQLFASNPSVRAGLKGDEHLIKPKPTRVPGATRSALYVSALHLNRHSIDVCGRDILGLSASRWMSSADDFYRNLAKVVWGVATGDDTSTSKEALLEALRLRSPLARTGRQAGTCDEYELTVATARGTGAPKSQELMYMMSMGFDHHLFGTQEGPTHPEISHRFDRTEVEARTRGVIELLSQAGCFDSTRVAAEWLSHGVLGKGCSRQGSVTPNCSADAALGFLEAIHAYGARTPDITWTANFTFEGRGGEHSRQAYESWETVLEVFERKKAMQKVIGETQAGQEMVQAEGNRRARRML